MLLRSACTRDYNIRYRHHNENEITMPKSWVSCFVSILAALVITACAHKTVKTAASTSQNEAGDAPNATIDPGSPHDIIALGKRVTQKRQSLFSISRGTYTFYVGGEINATYETTSEVLRIASLVPGESSQVCEYSGEGVLFVDPKIHPDKAAFVNTCNQQVMRLNDYLSR